MRREVPRYRGYAATTVAGNHLSVRDMGFYLVRVDEIEVGWSSCSQIKLEGNRICALDFVKRREERRGGGDTTLVSIAFQRFGIPVQDPSRHGREGFVGQSETFC